MNVKFRLDQLPSAFRQRYAKCRIVKQSLDLLGQSRRIMLRRDQTGPFMLDKLRDTGDIRRDARRTERHRLKQDRGQAVSVPIGADNTRRGNDSTAAYSGDDLSARPRSQQRNPIRESKTFDLSGQFIVQNSFAEDLTLKVSAVTGKNRAGVDKVGKTLLFYKAPNRQNNRRALGWRFVRELVKVQAVIDASNTTGIVAEGSAQVSDVEIADGDDGCGIAQLQSQSAGIDILMEDVFCMSGEGIWNTRDTASQAGN